MMYVHTYSSRRFGLVARCIDFRVFMYVQMIRRTSECGPRAYDFLFLPSQLGRGFLMESLPLSWDGRKTEALLLLVPKTRLYVAFHIKH